MRIIQIIDSLEVGGAEKMAVNYANALADRIEFSGIIATRKEGDLKNQINAKVDYLFLNRKKTIDGKAILKLRDYCKTNKIEYLQPHSSSFFTAVLVKLLLPNLKIIWHDHNGLSEFLSSRKSVSLKIASLFFSGIVVVNDQLKQWANRELFCKKVIYLPNFTVIDADQALSTQLHGIEGKRILCLANLRFQKNHFLLLEVAEKIRLTHPDWTFHLVGKDFEDEYSQQLKKWIKDKQLQNSVFIYGTKNDTSAIIHHMDIAVLSSQSEGLPVAILEYGLLKKPVISTEVGEIPLIIKNGINGFIVPSKNEELFTKSLVQLIENKELRNQFGEALFETIYTNHAQEAIVSKYLNWIAK